MVDKAGGVCVWVSGEDIFLASLSLKFVAYFVP